MKLYAKYISWVYIKYFLIVFVALELFYVGIDVLTNLKDFPQSANLAILYVCLTGVVAISYILPLSLVLAMIIMGMNLIRSNELVSFYALGTSKNALVLAPFLIALIITLFYIIANATPFVYAWNYRQGLAGLRDNDETSKEIFIKFENKFIYVDRLFADANLAKNIKIFEVDEGVLKREITASEGEFEDAKWKLKDVKVLTLPQTLDLNKSGYALKNLGGEEVLEGFEPKTIENIYENASSGSISDNISSLFLLWNENVSTAKIRSNLYSLTFFPLFAPLMVLIIYYYLPITGRFASLALTSFVFVLATLFVWGGFYILARFSQNGVIFPELGVIFPVLALAAFAWSKFYKNR